MEIIIAGTGEVGGHAADVLSMAGHNVTVIDLDADRLQLLNDSLDLRTLTGHCAHYGVLEEAGVSACDLFIAATQSDEINMLSSFLAKAAGAKKTISRVHHTANFSLNRTAISTKLGIDDLICPEHATAMAIARQLRNPGTIALEEFGKGQIFMQRFPVSNGASAIGKDLCDVQLPHNTRLAIAECGDVVSLATAKTQVTEGDVVTLIGEVKTFDSARKLFNNDKEKRITIAIMGQSSTAVWLGRALKSRLFSVRIFVEDRERAEELAEKLPHVTIIEGDPTDTAVFAEEHLEAVDVFIAVTEDDEHNILGCAQAKTLGVGKSIVVVQRTKYLHLFKNVGIDHAFSPRQVAVSAIEHLIDVGPVRSVAMFDDSVAEVYEVHPSDRASIIEKDLRTIKLPSRSMIAAIRRGDRVYVPGAEDQIVSGDTVLVIGPHGINEKLLKLFTTS